MIIRIANQISSLILSITICSFSFSCKQIENPEFKIFGDKELLQEMMITIETIREATGPDWK